MTAAETEERAEVELLRERADQTGREAAQTLAELAARLAAARDPRAMARRLAAQASRRVRAAVKAMPDNRAARRAAVAAVPVLGVLTVAVVARRQGWLNSHSPLPNVRVLRHRRLPPAVGECVISCRSRVRSRSSLPRTSASRRPSVKMYAYPGHTGSFTVTIPRPGEWIGRCAQLCGVYHYAMDFSVRAVTPAAFTAFLRTGGR